MPPPCLWFNGTELPNPYDNPATRARVELVASGSVADVSDADKTAIAVAIATAAGVGPSAVAVSVLAASVRIIAEITFDTTAQRTAGQVSLGSALATAEASTGLLANAGVTIIEAPTIVTIEGTRQEAGAAASTASLLVAMLVLSLLGNGWLLLKLRQSRKPTLRVQAASYVDEKPPAPRVPVQTRVPPRHPARTVPKEKPPPAPVTSEKPTVAPLQGRATRVSPSWQGQVAKPPPAFVQFTRSSSQKRIQPKVAHNGLGSRRQLPVPSDLPVPPPADATIAEEFSEWREPQALPADQSAAKPGLGLLAKLKKAQAEDESAVKTE